VGFLVVLLAFVASSAGAGSAPTSVNPNGLSFSAVEGVTFNATVATFTDDAAPSSSHSATIDWGDGSASYEGKVVPTTGKGVFNVNGSHVYTEEGSYTVRVHVTGGSGSGTTTLTATVTDAPLTAKVAVPAVVEGVALNAAIATVKDQDESDDPSEYRVTIDWGDGSTSAGRGTKTGPGTFNVLGSHTYAEEGGRTVTVKVDDAGGSTVTATQAITVADAPLAAGAPLTIGGTEGAAPKRGTVVATFQDANPATSAEDLSATINWGDGKTSRGLLVGTGGIWRVVGSHAYREEGTYRTVVVATDRGGATTTIEGKAVIRDAPLHAYPMRFTARVQTPFHSLVATFTDANRFAKASDFTATIDWGDGHLSRGALSTVRVGGHSRFGVTGRHTYKRTGRKRVTVAIEDRGGAVSAVHYERPVLRRR
jgi:large repetitive protein